jgi:hypothetical protein
MGGFHVNGWLVLRMTDIRPFRFATFIVRLPNQGQDPAPGAFLTTRPFLKHFKRGKRGWPLGGIRAGRPVGG